jgi:predicted GNAT family acetyltransferase
MGHAMEHDLDDLIWTALTGEQARFALGGDRARRFDPAIGPLAAVRDTAPASLDALAALLRETGTLALMQPGEPAAVPGAVVEKSALGVQMVFAGEAAAIAAAERAAADPRLVPLTPADYPAMLALATATAPGPFAARTGDLGDFWGVKEDGRLLAMAGQRLRTAGHAEVSAVCTDPAARGRGLAGLLSLRVVAAIRAGGRVPILHSYADNEAALGLYRKLGFVTRAHVRLTQYAPQD